MNLSFAGHPSLPGLLLLAVAVAWAVWAYTTRYASLSPRRRGILLGTRLLLLLALVLASTAPVVRSRSASRERNRLLVLVDHSGSMEVRDGGGGRSRRAAADSAAVAVARELGGRYDVRVAAFDVVLGPFGKDARAATVVGPSGGETGLGDAVHAALDRVNADSVAALLVVSDGAVNRGEDPERALGASVPAFGLVVGGESDPPTVGIAGVEAPPEVVAGRPATVSVSIRNGIAGPVRGVARLRDGNRELGRAPFALGGAAGGTGAAGPAGAVGTVRVTLPFTLEARGKHFLALSLDSLPDDPLTANKRRVLVVTARAPKRGAPILASSWDWDLRSVARGIVEDTTWATPRLVPSGSSAVATPGSPDRPLASALADAEVVVARFDARALSPDRAEPLLRWVERGGGLLLIADPRGIAPPPSALTRALGIEWRPWEQQPGLTVTTELTPEGRRHEVSLLGGDAASAAAAWRALPPVQAPFLATSRGGGSVPLVVGRTGRESLPILFAGRLGHGRFAVLNANGIYRWGLTASGLGETPGIEAPLFGGLARWLALGKEDRPVQIVAPDLTPGGRPVPVRLTVTAGTPGLAGLGARVTAFRPGSRVAVAETTLVAAGEGFAGRLTLPEGEYLLRGRVERNGNALGVDSVQVAVGEEGIEFESLRAEPAVLARMASRSGGVAAPLSASEPVLARLRSPEIARARLVETDLFHNLPLFLVIVLGGAAEWALRRRFHLI